MKLPRKTLDLKIQKRQISDVNQGLKDMSANSPLETIHEKPLKRIEMPEILSKSRKSTGDFVGDQLQNCSINFKYTLSKAQVDLKEKYGVLKKDP